MSQYYDNVKLVEQQLLTNYSRDWHLCKCNFINIAKCVFPYNDFLYLFIKKIYIISLHK